jgi:predicted MFS family arabinose efflux permease
MNNRWVALTIIFVSFIQFTLNWFCIIPGFGGIVGEMHLSFVQVGGIVGMFIAGYGIAHVPGGWIAERYGMRLAMLLGIAVETIGAAWSAWSPTYGLLLAARFACGVGGSVYLGSAVGLTTAWFRERELATANGLVTGVAFTVGAALGLFGWGAIAASLGWRESLLVGAAVGLLTFVLMLALFPTPPGEGSDVLEGQHLSAASFRRVFGNATLWLMGIAFLGAYGAYFSAAQLLPHYAQNRFGLDPAAAEAISVVLLISGIPGSFLGGWLADRVLGVLPTFLLGCALEGVALVLVPHLGLAGVQIAAAMIGGGGITAFVVWVTIPGQRSDTFHLSDIPTAAGLMFTLVAVGGAVVPPLFSQIAGVWGFPAAWGFEGVICLGFAALALLGLRPRPAVAVAHTRR